jgi:predicted dehydrogenase
MKDNTLKSDNNSPTIALVGCGAMAEMFYLPALSQYPQVLKELILVDSDLERARRTAERFGVGKFLADYREVVTSVHGVIIALPHHLHYSVSKDFLSSGVHVLCEKPLAETSAEVNEMLKLAENKGATISVNNTRRLFPSSGTVKRLIADGEIGTVLSISYYEGGEFTWPTTSGFYFNSKLSRKGVLLDIGAHVFDVICWWLGGRPQIISCENDSFGGCEAAVAVFFEHKRCKGEIRLSRLMRLPNYFWIRGEKGTIEGGVYDRRSVTLSTAAANGKQRKIQVEGDNSLKIADRLVANFLDVLAHKSRPLISASEVLTSIELLEEAYDKVTRFRMPWYDLEGAEA